MLVRPILERVPTVLVDLEAGDFIVQDSRWTLALHDLVVEFIVHLVWRLQLSVCPAWIPTVWLTRRVWHFIHHFCGRIFVVGLRPVILRHRFRLRLPLWLHLARVARVHILLRLCHLQALLLLGLLLAEIVGLVRVSD
jgi:hypothetical protein